MIELIARTDLAAAWAKRYNATFRHEKVLKVTMEDIFMETQSQQYSDRLDYEDELDERRRRAPWREVWQLDAADSSDAAKEARYIESYIYFADNGSRPDILAKRRDGLLARGYAAELIDAIPVTPHEEFKRREVQTSGLPMRTWMSAYERDQYEAETGDKLINDVAAANKLGLNTFAASDTGKSREALLRERFGLEPVTSFLIDDGETRPAFRWSLRYSRQAVDAIISAGE